MIRPSFVLGGRGMEVIYDEPMLREYVAKAVGVSEDRPLLLDRFLQHALECEADAVSDGEHVFIPAVMEHVELAGVHSGDSACIIPSANIPEDCLATIRDYTQKIAKALKVCGLMNMQYAIENGKVYVLEANPRASRTVPLVSKVCAIQMAAAATRLMLGADFDKIGLRHGKIPYYGAKEAICPFDKFPEVDPVLGPEMRSTGEVLGLARDPALAFCKSQEAANAPLPEKGAVLASLSVKNDESAAALKAFADLGFKLYATPGTKRFLDAAGIESEAVAKIGKGRPNVLDLIVNEQVDLVINTPSPRRDAHPQGGPEVPRALHDYPRRSGDGRQGHCRPPRRGRGPRRVHPGIPRLHRILRRPAGHIRRPGPFGPGRFLFVPVAFVCTQGWGGREKGKRG